MSELFLWPAADRNYDMRWLAFFYQRKQMSIFDFQSVPRRDITIIALDRKKFATETIEQFLARGLVWQDPEKARVPLTVQVCQESFQIFKTGNSVNLLASQQKPCDNN